MQQNEQSSQPVCSTGPNGYNQAPQTSQTMAVDHNSSPSDQSGYLHFHQQIKVQKPQFKCEQCHMSFGSKSAHTSHMKSHAKQYQGQQSTPNQGIIGIVPSLSPTIVTSTNGTTSAEPYQCDVCKKTFAVPARLVRHYRTHTGERPFACEFCPKTFSVKENLQVHRRIHTKERPYKCDVCGRAFEHSGKLHRHMRIHTGERPHKCSVCGKTFIQSGQLVIHMRTHTGEKPYKCPVEGCGKGFTCSKQLKVHSRTHTGEKPYHCDICFRDFGYNHVLKLHRVQHYGSKCYKCTICDETFKNKKEMEAHIKGHANDLPDDDEQPNESNMFSSSDIIEKQEPMSSPMSSDEPISLMTSPAAKKSCMSETPRDSSSEANSDGDDVSYYNMYSRFEHSVNYGVSTGGVNPALLAAASIAAAASAAGLDEPHNSPSSPISLSPNNNLTTTSSSNSNNSSSVTSMQPPPQQQHHGSVAHSNGFVYEPLAVMRHHGYFTPAPQSPEFRPSLASANLVRRVEEAIAIAEPLLTPPRSSPESPDRASSPESDSILLADRDIMSLPLRKRKIYLKDNQIGNNNNNISNVNNNSNNNETTNMRISSVIQFAKAS